MGAILLLEKLTLLESIMQPSKKENLHALSIEKLSHFRCGTCNKWWSIGDFDKTKIKELFCPWCGIKSKVKK